ncbi:MAG TPA: MFS transporter [Roseiarcus sp.]|nr:MFS transporter [Roseiarcus sp.]
MANGARASRPYDYRRLWLWLCLGWVVSSADRTITGPVITWMIQNKIAFMGTSHNPYALGGLIGGIFFAAYMLAQFPGGYAGDRHGHRSVIIISLFWAAIATLVSGLVGALVAFIVARILTGLGEGVYYANDRAIIADTTPEARRSLAMGVVITGLSIGITLATVGAPFLIDLGQRLLDRENAWRMPFFALAAVTALVSLSIARELWVTRTPIDRPILAFAVIARYAAPSFVLLFALLLVSQYYDLPPWALTSAELVVAFAVIAFIFAAKSKEMKGALHDRNLVLLYVSCVAILWNLWFFGFWAISIVAGNGANSYLSAALTAMFTGLAGVAGFPFGGWLADRARAGGLGRKPVVLTFTFLQAALTLALGLYIRAGGTAPVVLASLLFCAGLFFSALQPVTHALIADIARPEHRGSAFGLANLIGEIGAVLSPVVAGTLRDQYGGWAPAIYLDCAIILVSFVSLSFLRERIAGAAVAV